MTDIVLPSGLGERGAALYEHLSSTDVARNALALEAARTADRLDELDEIIHGRGVLNLMQFRVLDREMQDGVVAMDIEVKFQNVLGEARQQQVAFAGLLKTLGVEGSGVVAPPAPARVPLTGDSELEARRAAREGRKS